MIAGLKVPEIHIITGTEHAGKTTALIEVADAWKGLDVPVTVLKAEGAVGHGEEWGDYLESYGLLRVRAETLPDKSILLYPRLTTKAVCSDVICIDEAHLLPASLRATVAFLCRYGKTVYISGLWSYEGKASVIQGLVPFAETVRMKRGLTV